MYIHLQTDTHANAHTHTHTVTRSQARQCSHTTYVHAIESSLSSLIWPAIILIHSGATRTGDGE